MTGDSQGDSAKKTSHSKGSLDETLSRSQSTLVKELTSISIINKNMAQELMEEGYTGLKDIYQAESDEIAAVTGLKDKEVEKIKEEIEENVKGSDFSLDSGEETHQNEFTQWLTGDNDEDLEGVVSKEDRGKDEGNPVSQTENKNTDSLKAWLSGEKDSFTEWLGEETFEEEKEEIEEELSKREKTLEKREEELEEKEREIEQLRDKFETHVENIESDEFEPERIIEQNTELTREIGEKKEKIEELVEEKEKLEKNIEEIKKGTVAIVKYLKSQQDRDLSSLPKGSVDQTQTEESQTLKEENERLKDEIERLRSQPSEDRSEVMQSMDDKDKQLRELKEELTHKEEKIEDLKETVKHKEKELNEREDDLMHREKVLRKERQELEAKKKEMENKTEQERKRELEELKEEIERKEQELKAKEKYIDQKQKEIRAKEEDLIDEELEEREEEILREIEQEKCKTGTGRLDDLLLGGIPLGSNVSIYGPPHVGKEVMINSFVAEGLEKGVPAIWVITDKTIQDLREEMKFVLPTYEEYELRGLVYYVDAYSASMGEVSESEKEKDYVKYIKDQSDVKAITDAVTKFAEEINPEHRYYRMAFESVSTIIAYLDTETTFRTLQPFTGKRKKDRAVSLYSLEKGMHTDQEISMLGHIMDGEIKFKVDQLENYLKVEGLGDVQTRDWIGYSHSKSGITMGSFSLDTIK
ncbi:MAG: recombinase RecA [Candidatus Thermoplasmatota archaeon]|nr:recombinase RecA [Candidatus Thermoplasmatota archaeon]MBS3790383.1 recombinase RecA [Candidatus Thermoplasmatota archaeon]